MSVRTQIGFRITLASIAINFLLFGIKYYAGIQNDSIALIADAWHSLSDTITSAVIILGLWLASRPPDIEHPFGHGRSELIAAILVATILCVIAFEISLNSIERLNSGISVEYGPGAIGVLIISIISKEVLAIISIREGKIHDLESLKADGWHHRSDSISSAAILAGIFIGGNFVWLDGALGIFISVLLAWASVSILRSSVSSLLGKKASPEFYNQIIEVADATHPVVTDIHNIKLHAYGEHKEISFDMRLPNDMSVKKAHDIATIVEKEIYIRLKIRATAHIEPFKE